MAAKKKAAIQSISKELADAHSKGIQEVPLLRIIPDVNGPDAAYRRTILFKNFRVRRIWNKSTAVVLGPVHAGYCQKSRDAVTCNTIELFDHELSNAAAGLSLKQLTETHQKFCGAPPPDFKEVIGMELSHFVKQHFDYDEKKGKVHKKENPTNEPGTESNIADETGSAKESNDRAKKAEELNWLMSDPIKVQEAFQQMWGLCSTKTGTCNSQQGRGLMWSRANVPVPQSTKQEQKVSRSDALAALLSAIKKFDDASSEGNKLKARMENAPDELDKNDVKQLFQSSLFSLQALHKRLKKGEPAPAPVELKRKLYVEEEAQVNKRAKSWLEEYHLTSKSKK
eukprot:gnl/MRDRNA2_/MRDRNA2_83587_c0_seq3.p1 gnl/MRDRNA2_/MRDRNA2_83587_c0~~gnl/MRDRNA2_/MRDRNA2_83587_c0_seq3.p1  ORF type:complete len:340 (+),score=75.67 gnl/MRDRNA2_/MRDRNA2_83587_c0_seq3:158-1177(+)